MRVTNSQTRLHQVLEALQSYADRYGYERLETGLLQPADLFLTKAGDQLIQRLFTFDRLGRQYALRPEFTASAAKAYVEQLASSPVPPVMRWQFAGAVFEDVPDSAAIDQRYSAGAELIGWDCPSADAEIIALALGGLTKIGCESILLTLGSVEFMRTLLISYALDALTLRFLMEHLVHLNNEGKAFILDRFDKLVSTATLPRTPINADILSLPILMDGEALLGGRTREDILRRIQRKSERAASRDQVEAALDQLERLHAISEPPPEAFAKIRNLILPEQTEAAGVLKQFEALIPILNQYGIDSEQILIQPTLARDWNYYTGMVFELRSPQGTLLAGGGRYDELIRLVGGGDVPAVGMALYVDRLVAHASMPEIAARFPVTIRVSEDTAPVAAWWASRLRSEGTSVMLSEDESPASAGTTLLAQRDGSLRQGDKTFKPDNFAALLAQIKRG